MDNNVVSIFTSLVREVRSDIKSIRDVLAPMQADLKYHIMRTDLNENRIDGIEERLLAELERSNDIAAKKLKTLQVIAAICASGAAIGVSLSKMGLL